MPELTDILHLWKRIEAAGEPAVLATVVNTRGSSYRLPGAHLLLSSDGEHAGTISGGCLEEEILRKSWWITERGPLIRRYETTRDGEFEGSGYGLGCNGTIEVLLRRVSPADGSDLTLLCSAVEKRKPAAIAHVLRPSASLGQRLTIDTEGMVRSDITDAALERALEGMVASIRVSGESQDLCIGDAEIFVERLVPPVHLLVFGAGDDAIPLTYLAKYLGWQVSVFDGRAHYARQTRFPLADAVQVRENGAGAPAVDEWTAAVIMTHSYNQDLDILRQLALEPLPYLGLLGPRKRAEELLKEAALSERGLCSLHTPVGLDIGAEGPEQVALAICAEIQSVLNGRGAGFLKHREGSIHAEELGDRSARVLPSIACA